MSILLFLACALMVAFSIAKGGPIRSKIVLLMCAVVVALLLFGCTS